jgi:hypothetical protein
VKSAHEKCRSYKQFKWDCAVITTIVDEKGYAVVMAAFQEGMTGAYDFFRHRYTDTYVPSYQGVRYMDSVVACITDVRVITQDIDDDCIVPIQAERYPPGFFGNFCNLAPHPI